MSVPWRRRTVGCLIILLPVGASVALAVGVLRDGSSGREHPAGGPPAPAHGAYLGAAVAPQPPEKSTQEGRIAAIRTFESAVGTRLAIVHVYARSPAQIATPSNARFVADGHRLLISWATPDIRQIASGRQDAVIEAAAEQVAALRAPVFLEPRWEMDRPNLDGTVHSSGDFVAAWRRIRAVFADRDVDRVSWVWCPTAAGFEAGRAPAYYPGDSEVDWTCADPYPLRSYIAGTYESFRNLIRPFINWAAKHDKPIMIGEFGVPKSYGARRDGWLVDAFQYVRETPQIKALVYFDGPPSPQYPWGDYVLRGDRSALRAFASQARDRYFAGAM